MTRKSYTARFYSVKVGTKIPAKSFTSLKDLGLTRSAVGLFIDRVSTAVLLEYYSIWLGRVRGVRAMLRSVD